VWDVGRCYEGLIMKDKKIRRRAQLVYNKFLFNEQGKILAEILDIRKTLKSHGEAHLAQDLLPQFRELCKKVERIEMQMQFCLKDLNGGISRVNILEKRIEDLDVSPIKLRHKGFCETCKNKCTSYCKQPCYSCTKGNKWRPQKVK